MKILITGGNGFIGSHTVVELLSRGHEVVVVDNLCNSKQGVLNNINILTGRHVSFYCVDICDYNQMDSIFKKENIDSIIHFAALKSGKDSISNPGLYYHNNIDGTFVIVSLMKKYRVKSIVFSSSATVYGDDNNSPIQESGVVGNVNSPYGMTKYLCELYLKDQSKNNDFKVVSLRYFNPIGAHPSGLIGEDAPLETPNNLMLYLLKVANKELPYLTIFGKDYDTFDGTGVRDYIHVVDLALGHVAALDYLNSTKENYSVFNLGTGNGHTVIELINTFESTNGVAVPYVFGDRRPGDTAVSYANVDKAFTLMNWKAKYSLEDCVRDAWNYYKKKEKK